MQNIAVDMCEKFHDDRLRNDRALVLWKSDNNKNPKKTTLVTLGDPFPRSISGDGVPLSTRPWLTRSLVSSAVERVWIRVRCRNISPALFALALRPWIQLVRFNCYHRRPAGTAARLGLGACNRAWTTAVAPVTSSCTLVLSVVPTTAAERTDRQTNRWITHVHVAETCYITADTRNAATFRYTGNNAFIDLFTHWIRKRVPKHYDYERCSWGSCYHIFKVGLLRLFHFKTDRH